MQNGFVSDKERYHEYLASREWGLLRERVRERCGGVCERCKKSPMYAVHHLTYIRKYRERLEDLQGLCEPCHAYKHGKSDHDPLTPPKLILRGKEVRNVYLAGKVSDSHSWRESLVSGDMVSNYYADGVTPKWPPVGACHIRLKSGLVFNYTGPFYTGQNSHEPDFDYLHCNSTDHNCGDGILDKCLDRITTSDLVFAYIDTADCYGTIAELGYAKAMNKSIWIAGPKWQHDFWFVYKMADATYFNDLPPHEVFDGIANYLVFGK